MFWLDNSYSYAYVDDGVTAFYFDYLMDDKAEIEAKLRDIDMIADAVIDGTMKPQTFEMKMRKIYEWISAVCDYSENDCDLNNKTINLEAFENGTYLIGIISEGKQSVKQLIINK
jgi:hypothetical protein